jgi:hypothetical protein
VVTRALDIVCQTGTGLFGGEDRGSPVVGQVSYHANEEGSADEVAADGGRLAVPEAADCRRRAVHQANTQEDHCDYSLVWSYTKRALCLSLTIGNAVLISTEDEDDDWKPESDHLASGAAGGHAEHDGHAHHHVCWNGTKEDLAPVFGNLLAHPQAKRPTRERRLTRSFELAENEFIQV